MTAERKPITRQRSAWLCVEESDEAGWPVSIHRRNAADGTLLAIVANEPIGWHLSISFRDHRGNPTRYPTWDEIADARDVLLPADLAFVMHLPRAGEYVALHDTTFHLHQHDATE